MHKASLVRKYFNFKPLYNLIMHRYYTGITCSRIKETKTPVNYSALSVISKCNKCLCNEM